MDNEIAELLKRLGPLLSGRLTEALVQEKGVSPAAARQRLQRHSSPVKHLELPFAKRARFFYLQQQYGTPLFWQRLGEALEANEGAYSRVIKALNARGGIIPLAHLSAAAACSDGEKQLSASEVVKRLTDARLVEEINLPGIGPSLAYAKGASYIDDALPEVRARLICEAVLLDSVKEWAAKLGLGSFQSFRVRGSSLHSIPMVSVFAWDMTAPSYLAHLANWSGSEPKPGFLTVDLLLKPEVELSDISPFLYKCASMSKVGSARCLHFFIAHLYSQEALNEVRRAGVVPATVESLFGTEVAKALLQLAQVLREAAAESIDLEKFDYLFRTLGKIEGAAGRLRGALFEFLVATVVRIQKGDAVPQMNRIYRQDGKDAAEVDVCSIGNGTGRFIECKGYIPGHFLPDDEMHAWLTKRIPLVRKQTLENLEHSNLKFVFEMWLTGELTDTAKEMLKSAQERASGGTKYSIEFYGPKEIEAMVKKTGDKNLLKVLRDHFLNAPLAIPVSLGNPVSKRRITPFDRGVVWSKDKSEGRAD